MSFLRSSYFDRLLGRTRSAEAPPQRSLAAKEEPVLDVNRCQLQWNEADGSRASENARIGCRAANGFVVWCESPILPGTEVSIFGSVPGRAAVTFCRTDAGMYLLILAPLAGERRRWERETATGTAVLNWGTVEGIEQTSTVTVRNLGRDGLQISSREPIAVPSIVRVSGEAIGCIGSTCYCWQVGEEYIVGIQFVQDPFLKDSPDYDEED